MTEPASIRYNNPGAMWGGARANKWGATNDIVLKDGQSNHIAVFPTKVQGAAAQFDLWRSGYAGMSLSAAVHKWSGGNSSPPYMAFLERRTGIAASDVITVDLLAGPEGLALMKAQAYWEAGKPYPMTDDDWLKAQQMVFVRGAPQVAIRPNVRPQQAAYSLDVEVLQRKLDSLGYHEVGDIDGKWGGKTKGALTALMNDRHVDLVVNGGPTPQINQAVSDAVAQGWMRPIAVTRATATAKDIAPKVEAVRQTIWQRLGAKIAGYVGLGAATVTSISDNFASVNDKVAPVKQFFTDTPGWVWFGLIALVSFIIFLSADKVQRATVADYNTGKIN